jgi:hypothetical protein
MNTTSSNGIWNRAALEAGGDSPRPGDRALASLLLVHGLVMNGGVHHALEGITPEELLAATDGYEFFGFYDVAAFFRGASEDPMLSNWTDDTEVAANRRYAERVPDDSCLVARFEEVLREACGTVRATRPCWRGRLTRRRSRQPSAAAERQDVSAPSKLGASYRVQVPVG